MSGAADTMGSDADDDTRRFALGESLAEALAAGEAIDVEAYAARHGLAADDVRDALAASQAQHGPGTVRETKRTAGLAVVATAAVLGYVVMAFIGPRSTEDDRALELAEAALAAHDVERAVGLLRELEDESLEPLSGELLAAALLARVDAAAEHADPEARRVALNDVIERAGGKSQLWWNSLAWGEWGGIEGRALAGAAIELANGLAQPNGFGRSDIVVGRGAGLEDTLVAERLLAWVERPDAVLAARAGAMLLTLLGALDHHGACTFTVDPDRTRRALLRAFELQQSLDVVVRYGLTASRVAPSIFAALTTTTLARDLARFDRTPLREFARRLARHVGDVPLHPRWSGMDASIDAAATVYDAEVETLGAAARFERAVQFALDVLAPIDDRHRTTRQPRPGPAELVLSEWFGRDLDLAELRAALASTPPRELLAARLGLPADPARWDPYALAERLRDGPHEDGRALHAALAYTLPAWDRGVPWSWQRHEPPSAAWEQVLGPSAAPATLTLQWALVSDDGLEIVASGAARPRADGFVRFDVAVPLARRMPAVAARGGRYVRPRGLDGRPLALPFVLPGGGVSAPLELAGRIVPGRLGPSLVWSALHYGIWDAPLRIDAFDVPLGESMVGLRAEGPFAVGTVHAVCACYDRRALADERGTTHLVARLALDGEPTPPDLAAWRAAFGAAFTLRHGEVGALDATVRTGQGRHGALMAQLEALEQVAWLSDEHATSREQSRRPRLVDGAGVIGSTPERAPRSRAQLVLTTLRIGLPTTVVLVVLFAFAQAWAQLGGWRHGLRRAGTVLFVGLAALGCDTFGSPSFFAALFGVGALGASLVRRGAAARVPAALILAGAALHTASELSASSDVRFGALARAGAATLVSLGALLTTPFLAAALRRSARHRVTLEVALFGLAALVFGGAFLGALGALAAWTPSPALARAGEALVSEVRSWWLADALDGPWPRLALLGSWVLLLRFVPRGAGA